MLFRREVSPAIGVDVNVNFYDGKMPPSIKTIFRFRSSAVAFKEAFLKARPCLLEPIHSLEVLVPEDCVGKVIGNLSSRPWQGGENGSGEPSRGRLRPRSSATMKSCRPNWNHR
jgi:hypothetical protein